MIKKIYICFLFLFLGTFLKATHNRAGEITYKWISGYTYSITLITYTDDGPSVADRCKLTIYFGDGDSCQAIRENGFNAPSSSECPVSKLGVILKPTFKKNVYSCIHTYDGPGLFKIYMFDRNRNSGVINVPNSVNQPFYLETLLSINVFMGPNNSPVLTRDPLDEACLNNCFYHNPGAYDIDNDSLSYELVMCKGEDALGNIGVTIPGYGYPNPGSGPGNTFNINAGNGTLTWCEPQMNGEYNVAFYIKEWRKDLDGNWQLVGFVMRDMQIIVSNCTNSPPVITPMQDTCVVAGTLITKTFRATDSNIQLITLTATGGPFNVTPPVATFGTVQGTGTVSGTFNWQTACAHVRSSPYQVTVKAEDSGSPVKLVDFKTYNITVVGPPPLNLSATPLGTSVKLIWFKSACNNVGLGNKVTHYKVYRKANCDPWVHSPCETGVPPSSGFGYIGQTTSINDTTFTDTNGGVGLAHGVSYSYVVVAVYADGSLSYASNQVCVQLKRDVPIVINVDVLATSTSTGQVFVRWVKPIANLSNLDTTILTGPYEFRISAKQGLSGTFSQVYSVTKPYYAALNQLSDTTFTHSNINTDNSLWVYKLDFYSNNTFVGSAQTASSVFLTLAPADRKMNLSWVHYVPWGNYKYFIYRKDPSQVSFVLHDSTTSLNYIDSINVVNRATYCYKVLSKGEYSDPNILKPLLNNSQEECAEAVDLTVPCSPTLSIASNCETGFVELKWNNPNRICSDDVIKYYIYFKPTEDEPLALIDSVSNLSDTTYVFDGLESIAGCYVVTAKDSSYNESIMAEATCVDNCPEFELPNVVTMNGDGANDFYKAIRVKHIKDIDLNIFNRWGQLVYHTTDPYFNWDGKVIQTKMLCSEGTYFYTCEVNEKRVKPRKPRLLKGFIQVFHK
ncbi:MAG: gliding motility-associated C-terminal domain-containing protein [Bacteroidia bacterium]|nr:gliding motility-associated C-terminal domain-containing protein [Bacteroidia bacterium]